MNLNLDKSSKKSKQVIAIILIIVISILLGGLILNTEKPKVRDEEHGEHTEGEAHSEHEEGTSEETLGLDKKAIEAH